MERYIKVTVSEVFTKEVKVIVPSGTEDIDMYGINLVREMHKNKEIVLDDTNLVEIEVDFWAEYSDKECTNLIATVV